MCVCVCARACVRACVRACLCVHTLTHTLVYIYITYDMHDMYVYDMNRRWWTSTAPSTRRRCGPCLSSTRPRQAMMPRVPSPSSTPPSSHGDGQKQKRKAHDAPRRVCVCVCVCVCGEQVQIHEARLPRSGTCNKASVSSALSILPQLYTIYLMNLA